MRFKNGLLVTIILLFFTVIHYSDSARALKKLTIHTSRKLYPLDVASLVTGPLEVFKRCQDKPDLNLNITLQEIKDASKKILG